MRRVLDPMFIYFDSGRHWAARHGLALRVLSDMSYLVKSSGNFVTHHLSSLSANIIIGI